MLFPPSGGVLTDGSGPITRATASAQRERGPCTGVGLEGHAGWGRARNELWFCVCRGRVRDDRGALMTTMRKPR